MRMSAPRVLVVDDQRDVLEALRLLLKPEGFDVTLASSPRSALEALDGRAFDAALVDLNYARDTTSGQEGLQLVADLQARAPDLPVLVMTAWGSIALAVEAMRRGAVDFVTKPWDNDALVAMLGRCLDRGSVQATSAVGVRELAVARAAQQRLLPRSLPRLATLTCAAACEETGAVGGDFFDCLDLGPGLVGLVVADVSGKGVPAAIVMAHVSATIRSLAHQMRDELAGVVRTLNALLLETTTSQHYVTALLAVYDQERRVLRLVNCGHPPPLLRRGDGSMAWLDSTAPVLGLLETVDVQEVTLAFDAGSTLVVYSDGLTETQDASGAEFGTERIASLVSERSTDDAEAVLSGLLEARRAFASGVQHDDVTILVAQGHPWRSRA